MKPLVLGQAPPNATDKQKLDWIISALRKIELASREDTDAIWDIYSYTGTLTVTRALNVSSPTLANAVAVLSTLIDDSKKRGTHRIEPT
jgi:hypothetical protein